MEQDGLSHLVGIEKPPIQKEDSIRLVVRSKIGNTKKNREHCGGTNDVLSDAVPRLTLQSMARQTLQEQKWNFIRIDFQRIAWPRKKLSRISISRYTSGIQSHGVDVLNAKGKGKSKAGVKRRNRNPKGNGKSCTPSGIAGAIPTFQALKSMQSGRPRPKGQGVPWQQQQQQQQPHPSKGKKGQGKGKPAKGLSSIA